MLEEFLAEIEPCTYDDGVWTEDKIINDLHQTQYQEICGESPCPSLNQKKESYKRFFNELCVGIETGFINPTQEKLSEIYHKSPDYYYINALHKRLLLIFNHFLKLQTLAQNFPSEIESKITTQNGNLNDEVNLLKIESFNHYVKQYGVSLYYNKRRLSAVIADIFNDDRLGNILKFIIEIGIAKEVADLLPMDPLYQGIGLHRMIYSFSKQYDIGQPLIEKAIHTLACALDMEI